MANNVVLSGRLTRDPELRYLQGGSNTAVCRFNLAVDKNLSRDKRQELESKGQPTADFINCVAWGRLGENVAKYTGKGLRVLVTGRIQTGSYEKDGQRIYTTDVQAANVEFLDYRENQNQQSADKQAGSYAHQPVMQSATDDFTPDSYGDKRIPF